MAESEESHGESSWLDCGVPMQILPYQFEPRASTSRGADEDSDTDLESSSDYKEHPGPPANPDNVGVDEWQVFPNEYQFRFYFMQNVTTDYIRRNFVLNLNLIQSMQTCR